MFCTITLNKSNLIIISRRKLSSWYNNCVYDLAIVEPLAVGEVRAHCGVLIDQVLISRAIDNHRLAHVAVSRSAVPSRCRWSMLISCVQIKMRVPLLGSSRDINVMCLCWNKVKSWWWKNITAFSSFIKWAWRYDRFPDVVSGLNCNKIFGHSTKGLIHTMTTIITVANLTSTLAHTSHSHSAPYIHIHHLDNRLQPFLHTPGSHQPKRTVTATLLILPTNTHHIHKLTILCDRSEKVSRPCDLAV